MHTQLIFLGGYVILKQPHCGLVIGTSARFTTTLSVLQAQHAKRKRDNADELVSCNGTVRVDSPQFNNTNWYRVTIDDEADGNKINITPT